MRRTKIRKSNGRKAKFKRYIKHSKPKVPKWEIANRKKKIKMDQTDH